jgi:hypothetical protein
MHVRFPFANVGSILDELKSSTWARNVTYRGRVLWKTISVQRDLGDIIIQADYIGRGTKIYTLSEEEFEKMQRLESVNGMGLELYGVSRDLQYITESACSSIEEVLSSPLTRMNSFVDFANIPVIKSLSRGKVRLVNDMSGTWSFVQYP